MASSKSVFVLHFMSCLNEYHDRASTQPKGRQAGRGENRKATLGDGGSSCVVLASTHPLTHSHTHTTYLHDKELLRFLVAHKQGLSKRASTKRAHTLVLVHVGRGGGGVLRFQVVI